MEKRADYTFYWFPILLGIAITILAMLCNSQGLHEQSREKAKAMAGCKLAILNVAAFKQIARADGLRKAEASSSMDLTELRTAFLMDAAKDAYEVRQMLKDSRQEYENWCDNFGVDQDKALVTLTQRNEALMIQYAELWEDMREWTYDAESASRQSDSGRSIVQAFWRGLNGSPLRPPSDLSSDHDQIYMEAAKLIDSLRVLWHESDTRIDEINLVVEEYITHPLIRDEVADWVESR